MSFILCEVDMKQKPQQQVVDKLFLQRHIPEDVEVYSSFLENKKIKQTLKLSFFLSGYCRQIVE